MEKLLYFLHHHLRSSGEVIGPEKIKKKINSLTTWTYWVLTHGVATLPSARHVIKPIAWAARRGESSSIGHLRECPAWRQHGLKPRNTTRRGKLSVLHLKAGNSFLTKVDQALNSRAMWIFMKKKLVKAQNFVLLQSCEKAESF